MHTVQFRRMHEYCNHADLELCFKTLHVYEISILFMQFDSLIFSLPIKVKIPLLALLENKTKFSPFMLHNGKKGKNKQTVWDQKVHHHHHHHHHHFTA